MTEIPEHLLRRAQQARERAATTDRFGFSGVPGSMASDFRFRDSRASREPSLEDQIEEAVISTFEQPRAATNLLAESFSEMEDGPILDLSISRDDGKWSLKMTISDKSMASLLVSYLTKLK